MNTDIYTYKCRYIFMNRWIQIYIHINVDINMYIHTYIYIYEDIYIYTYVWQDVFRWPGHLHGHVTSEVSDCHDAAPAKSLTPAMAGCKARMRAIESAGKLYMHIFFVILPLPRMIVGQNSGAICSTQDSCDPCSSPSLSWICFQSVKLSHMIHSKFDEKVRIIQNYTI